MPNIDPRQMEKLMRQMGVNTKSIPASLVIIEADDGRILIKNPEVTEVSMGSQKTFQIVGEAVKELKLNEEDVLLVMGQSGATRDQAIDALKKTKGDIAEAILQLKKQE